MARIVLRRRLHDLSYVAPLRWVSGAASAAVARALELVRRAGAASHWARAHRHHLFVQTASTPTAVQRAVETRLRAAAKTGTMGRWSPWNVSKPLEDPERLLKRGIALKAPRWADGIAADAAPTEKGVLLMTFSAQFTDLRRACDMDRLLRDYQLVLEPSFSGYVEPNIVQFLAYPAHDVVVAATEGRDFELMRRLDANLEPVPFGASDWVDPTVFRPLPNAVRRYDAVMLAGWESLKRHHVFFRAVRDAALPDYRFLLIGNSWKAPRSEIEALLAWYGLTGQADLVEGLSATQVNEALNSAWLNVLVTRREGSNRSLFEGMFADVPALALREVIGPQHGYFTPQSGMLTPERDLASALRTMREQRGTHAPREWALANISPQASTAKLNAVLRGLAERRGQPWTVDIVAKCNAPEVTYLDPADATRLPTMSAILARYRRSF